MAQMNEIEAIYKQCGVETFKQMPIQNEINRGSLSNKLNVGFSNMSRRNGINSLSGLTVTKIR